MQEEGIDTEIFQIGAEPLRDCIGCGGCSKGNGCVFRDDCVNEFVEKAKEADGFVFGTPVYYAHPSGRIMSFLDRAFYSGGAIYLIKLVDTSFFVSGSAMFCAFPASKHFNIHAMHFAALRMVCKPSKS